MVPRPLQISVEDLRVLSNKNPSYIPSVLFNPLVPRSKVTARRRHWRRYSTTPLHFISNDPGKLIDAAAARPKDIQQGMGSKLVVCSD